MALKAVMVDVDGVVVAHPHPQGWSVNLERDLGLSVRRLQDEFFKPHFSEIVHGRAGLRDRLAPVLADIAPHLSCEQLIAYWFEQDSHLDRRLLDDLAAIRAEGVELHLATVQEHERADDLWRRVGLSAHFDAMHYAADLGWAKPSPRFYAAIEARTGFRPDEIFFIDDKPANVEAALARGWSAAHWTGRDRLADLILATRGP